MLMKKSLLLALSLTLAAVAEPNPNLPKIEINSSPTLNSAPAKPASNTIELPPIQGQKPEKLSGEGRVFWGSPYGMPAGPGRAWPDAAPPGAPGPAGGLLTPANYPGRYY